MQMPQELQTAIGLVANGQTGTAGRDAARSLSDRYRDKRRHSREQMVSTADAAVAYAASRMPATWAAIGAAMEQVAALCPEWSPNTMLDIGAGTGAALWAATRVWPCLETASLLERSGAMMAVGRRLATHGTHDALRNADWHAGDLMTADGTGLADGKGKPALVTVCYMLNELGAQALAGAVDRLWRQTGDILLVVEPGTPDAWERMMQIRRQLLEAGAHLVGPCPHTRPCPVVAPDWCHFSERVNRLRLHRDMKEGKLAYEDEKFTWLAFGRNPSILAEARVLRHPEKHSGFFRLSLCTRNGLLAKTVTRGDAAAWRAARDIRAGDAWQESPVGESARLPDNRLE